MRSDPRGWTDPAGREPQPTEARGSPLKVLYHAAALVLLLWLLFEIRGVLVLFGFALVLAIVLNAPVTWLEGKRVHRAVGTVIVIAGVVAIMALLGWLVIPRLIGEVTALFAALPEYVALIAERAASRLEDYPEIEQRLRSDAWQAAAMIPSLPTLLDRAQYFLVSILGLLAVGALLFGMVFYMVANPRPLLTLYLTVLPTRLHEPATRAFARASEMVVGWMWSNIVAGAIKAVAAGIVLSLLGVPGAILWAVWTFSMELVPTLGVYLMAIPPLLVALSVDPMDAVWVVLFYLILNTFMGNFVTPYVRASTMNLHPVSILLVLLAAASAFGVIAVFISAPLAAFIKAYYEEFYVARSPGDPRLRERIERMLQRTAARDGP